MARAMPPLPAGRQLAARADAAKAGFRSGSDRLRGQRRGGWLAGKHRVLTTGLSSAADLVLAGCRPHATGSTGADYDLSALFADPEATVGMVRLQANLPARAQRPGGHRRTAAEA